MHGELVALLKMNRQEVFQPDYVARPRGVGENISMARITKRVVPRFKPQRRRIFLKEWRKYRGMTQEQLAEAAGMVVSNVAQLEQGRQGYSDKGLEALADALRCTPGQILMVDPTRDEAIWSIWETANQGDRQKIIDIAKTITGKTGTDR
jgi:DNA-binding Xre family transcriptional regulator